MCIFNGIQVNFPGRIKNMRYLCCYIHWGLYVSVKLNNASPSATHNVRDKKSRCAGCAHCVVACVVRFYASVDLEKKDLFAIRLRIILSLSICRKKKFNLFQKESFCRKKISFFVKLKIIMDPKLALFRESRIYFPQINPSFSVCTLALRP